MRFGVNSGSLVAWPRLRKRAACPSVVALNPLRTASRVRPSATPKECWSEATWSSDRLRRRD
jgi:hypothetical protein